VTYFPIDQTKDFFYYTTQFKQIHYVNPYLPNYG
jgi:hypothetical protein